MYNTPGNAFAGSHATLGYVTAGHHQLLLDFRPVEFDRVRSDADVMRRKRWWRWRRRRWLLLVVMMMVRVAKRFRRHVVPTASGVARRGLAVVNGRPGSSAQRTRRRRRRPRQRRLWHLRSDGRVGGYPSGHRRVVRKLYAAVPQFGLVWRIYSTNTIGRQYCYCYCQWIISIDYCLFICYTIICPALHQTFLKHCTCYSMYYLLIIIVSNMVLCNQYNTNPPKKCYFLLSWKKYSYINYLSGV